MLHLLLHVTALCQRKKNTFWAEDLKLDQAIFRLNKKNEFGYVARILCSVPDFNSNMISPSQVFHIDEDPIDERNSSKKKIFDFSLKSF